MRGYPNIDKSAFRQGEYVGYAEGTVWRICRTARGWTAYRRDGQSAFTRRTLREISEGLTVTAEHIRGTAAA